MTPHDAILQRLRGDTAGSPLFLPNLTLWYGWHSEHGTLPTAWRGWSLPQIARSLDVPAWQAARPYVVNWGAVEVVRAESAGERVIQYRASDGALTERWTLGPDGDWWQTEYPVKTPDDLPLLVQIAANRRYVVDTTKLERLQREVGDDGVVAVELPRRPFSQVFLEWLGWSDGLLLFFDAQELVEEIIAVLEDQVQVLVEQIASLPGQVVVSPDNLDAQFVSPAFFKRYLAASYRRTAGLLHAHDKVLLAGTGGPIRKLLAPLAATGVDGLDGVSGPPQSDASLAEARSWVGADFILWGGIPQDALLPDFDPDQFEAIVAQAAREASAAPRAILGVADVVPIHADLARLHAIPTLIAQSASAH
jgi:hypothetical protein